MKDKIRWITQKESGQGLVEYSLLISLIALMALGGLIILKNGVVDLYKNINSNIS